MVYTGFSIIGESDYMKELRERGAQKAALRKKMRAEMEANVELFQEYIERSYSVTTLPDEMKKMHEMIESNFSGMAKRALEERFLRNMLQLNNMTLNKNIVQHSFSVKRGILWF